MAYVLRQIYNFYKFYMVEYSDPRSENLPLVSNPLPVLAILSIYLYGVLSFGPRLMEKRSPFQIKNILIFYNAFQIISNIVVWFYIVYWTYYQGTFNLHCNLATTATDTSILGQHQVYATYYYFLLKILDLFDTLFFVMRKRFSHITFLHVYHHTAMVIAVWISVRFLPAGHAVLLGVLNCLVHAIMYSYYLISAIDENLKQSIWWKRHITQVQMIQFLLLVLHFGQVLIRGDCHYPKFIASMLTIQNVFMLFMFADFYRNAYLKKKKIQ